MANVEKFRSRAEIEAEANVEEFIRYCRDDLTWLADRDGFDWDAPSWPRARWAKVTVGTRRHFSEEEQLDAAFVEFAKAYFRDKNTERETGSKRELAALKCLEAALLTVTGSGSVHGMTLAVLDEAAIVARKHYSAPARYHVGRNVAEIARFVSARRLVPVDVSTWKSPLKRPSSVRRTGDAGQREIASKLPSQAGLHAMAEMFANDPHDPIVRFISAVWALLMTAPWRISEVLRLHVDAEHEEKDDRGVVSYGLRYYGSKGFEYDIKWVPKVMEPVAREAFRRIRDATESARRLARHLETDPEAPFLYADVPKVGLDDELSVAQKAAYLRWRVPKGRGHRNPSWRVRSIREHWAQARTKLPEGFPIFAPETGLRWSEALFCMHRDFLHETRSTDWYRLGAPTANTINDLLRPSGEKKGVLWKQGYREPDGRPIVLTTHQARHYLSTIAELGDMAQEHSAKWAARATQSDNRVYNHMSEEQRVARVREVLAGTELAGLESNMRVKEPTTRAEFNHQVQGPSHRTPWGGCEHDWSGMPCMKFAQCLLCTEHSITKGDQEAYARIKEESEHQLEECDKALAAIRAGKAVADRWLEHALNLLLRQWQLLELLESDDIEDGATIRLNDPGAEHTHLRRALEQQLPRIRDTRVPDDIKAVIRRYINGETLVEAARGGNCRRTERLASGHSAHLERPDQAHLATPVDRTKQADARSAGADQDRVRHPKSRAAQRRTGRRR